jgi:putative ABC transport system ATP-binding protein
MLSMSLIELRNVTKTYGGAKPVSALADVNLHIGEGDFVAVMGPSGSGKTTLLTVLGGLSQPTSGEVVVDGFGIHNLSPDRQADYRYHYLGLVFQEHQLLPHLTALENVLLALVVRGEGDEPKVEAALQALGRVGLAEKADRLPGELSGGEQARVGIARALVRKPPIILADEPTGNLDSRTGREILTLLRNLNGEGHTIILVTHNEDAAQSAKRVLRVSDGKIVSDEHSGGLAPDDSWEDAEALVAARDVFETTGKSSFSLTGMLFPAAIVIQVLIFILLIWLALSGAMGH